MFMIMKDLFQRINKINGQLSFLFMYLHYVRSVYTSQSFSLQQIEKNYDKHYYWFNKSAPNWLFENLSDV